MKETLSVPEVKRIAETLSISPAQVVISWHVQRGVSDKNEVVFEAKLIPLI